MYISLSSSETGYACAISQSIINNVGKKETYFFDWLVCSLKSVNEILEGKKIIFEKKYIYPNISKTTTIKFENFDKLISHHDIKIPNKNKYY